MKKSILIPLLLLLTGGSLMAQKTETLFDNNGLGVTGIWGATNYNYSFFNEDEVYSRGGNIGLEFGSNFFVGYGWSRFRERATPEGLNSFRIRHNGVVIGLAPGARKVIHPRLTMMVGGGKVFLDNSVSDRVLVLQPSAGLEVNVFQWFRISAEGGYRIIANENLPGFSAQDISAPFAQIDLRFGISSRR